jgi:RsiW-degrading membrane proteinase PrsW (M82 family)
MMKLDPAFIAYTQASPAQKAEINKQQKQLNICESTQDKQDNPPPQDTTKIGKLILLVGFFEEAAKLIFPLLVLLLVPLARRNVSIGLGLGALTALGFAVLESLYYGLADFPAFGDLGFMLLNCSETLLGVIGKTDFILIFRDLTTPFGHLAWTGLACVVIWSLVTSDKSNFAKVTLSFGIYVVVATLHSLNDFFLENAGNDTYSTLMLTGELIIILLSFTLFYFSLRLAIFKDKPASVQVWEKMNTNV